MPSNPWSTAIYALKKIPVDFSLTIRFRDFANRADLLHQKSHLRSVINIFIRHVELSLQPNIYNTIDITYEYKRITWICRTALPIPRILSISMHLCGDSDANVLEAFLKKLFPFYFTSVTKLRFSSNRGLNPFFAFFYSPSICGSYLHWFQDAFPTSLSPEQIQHAGDEETKNHLPSARGYRPYQKLLGLETRLFYQ